MLFLTAVKPLECQNEYRTLEQNLKNTFSGCSKWVSLECLWSEYALRTPWNVEKKEIYSSGKNKRRTVKFVDSFVALSAAA